MIMRKDLHSLGQIMTPLGKESTPETYYFWTRQTVEKTQLVVAEVQYPERPVTFYGIVDDVWRVGEEQSIHEGRWRDGDKRIVGEGTTYARVTVLATEPEIYTAPLAGAEVRAATRSDAARMYSFDKIKRGFPVGLLRNGATGTAGPAMIDPGFLLGENGAHLNVNGISGVATKTSAMLVTIMSILQTANRYRREAPSAPDHVTPVPVLFSVKGTDMLWIDQKSRAFEERPELADHWREMGLEPKPFEHVKFLVPGRADSPRTAQSVVRRTDLVAYSWALADVVEAGLLRFLFAETDRSNSNFLHLVEVFEERLTHCDRHGRRSLRPAENAEGWGAASRAPQTFAEWAELLRQEIVTVDGQRHVDHSVAYDNTHVATLRAFYRRLRLLRGEGDGVIAWDHVRGQPPKIQPSGCDAQVYVIDIASLARSPAMQRFVIASVLQSLAEERSDPHAARGIRYLIGLDELNRWAPKASRDATTQLFEKIAAEMRSLGIILLGAQQFASHTSPTVIGNASCRMIGRTDAGELSDGLWRSLSDADKRMASRLQPGQQLLLLPPYRAPAHVLVPFPSWATRAEDVVLGDSWIESADDESAEMPSVTVTGSNLFV